MLVTVPPFHWVPLDFCSAYRTRRDYQRLRIADRNRGIPEPRYVGHCHVSTGVRPAWRRGSTTGSAYGIAESSMNPRESERSRRHGDLEGTGWAPRRNGAPSIPADSARGSSSFLLLLLPSPICDHRRRHRARSSRLWRWPPSQLYDVIAGCCHRARGEMRSRRTRVVPKNLDQLPLDITHRVHTCIFPHAKLFLF